MNDPAFIKEMLEKGLHAKQRVIAEFSNLNLEQLNWKLSPESWSIGQCLDHLVVADTLYFPAFKKIAAGEYKNKGWQKWNPFRRLFGKMLVNQVSEKVVKKMKAPKVFTPSSSTIDLGILDRFQKHMDTLLECIRASENLNIDKIQVTSPVGKFVTYSLRHAIQLLVQHLHRHINQAMRVKQTMGYPI